MRISDWSSDVCSSDLGTAVDIFSYTEERKMERALIDHYEAQMEMVAAELTPANHAVAVELASLPAQIRGYGHIKEASVEKVRALEPLRSEEHTSELQSLMRISYAVFCLKKKIIHT